MSYKIHLVGFDPGEEGGYSEDLYRLALAIDEAFSDQRLEDTSQERKEFFRSDRFLHPDRYKQKIRNISNREKLVKLLERALRADPKLRPSVENFEKSFEKWVKRTYGSLE